MGRILDPGTGNRNYVPGTMVVVRTQPPDQTPPMTNENLARFLEDWGGQLLIALRKLDSTMERMINVLEREERWRDTE